jgi:hypothetical protein
MCYALVLKKKILVLFGLAVEKQMTLIAFIAFIALTRY